MPELVIRSTRPWYTTDALLYWLDPAPRYVVAGVEYEGSWGRSGPTRLPVSEGSLHLEAYRERWHPIWRMLARRASFRRAAIDIDVPPCERVVVEFRASALSTQPGRLRVQEIIGQTEGDAR